MRQLPTDLKILECLYAMYADTFREFSRENPTRDAKIYVPIDVRRVAQSLKTDPHVLFGRLYYHLDHKYRYDQENGARVHLFAFQTGNDRHCINYPYLAAILSEQRTEHRRNLWAIVLSIISLILALASIIAQVITTK